VLSFQELLAIFLEIAFTQVRVAYLAAVDEDQAPGFPADRCRVERRLRPGLSLLSASCDQ